MFFSDLQSKSARLSLSIFSCFSDLFLSFVTLPAESYYNLPSPYVQLQLNANNLSNSVVVFFMELSIFLPFSRNFRVVCVVSFKLLSISPALRSFPFGNVGDDCEPLIILLTSWWKLAVCSNSPSSVFTDILRFLVFSMCVALSETSLFRRAGITYLFLLVLPDWFRFLFALKEGSDGRQFGGAIFKISLGAYAFFFAVLVPFSTRVFYALWFTGK
mmetsp:Transcript_17786/g.35524  ORF Transcript_17786/g.35524 Transcript_17786/m.35524 type:complete len:216 (-) Transcript_17786:13-660(-)